MAIIFNRPATPPRVLPTAPVLESWEKVGHPDQRRLGAYLYEVQALVSSAFPDVGDHLGLELMVGMPAELAYDSGGRDLDDAHAAHQLSLADVQGGDPLNDLLVVLRLG